MKKIFIFLFGILFLISCDYQDPSDVSVKSGFVTSSEYDGNILTIDYHEMSINKTLKYYKCNIKGHDFWIRSWETKYGYGSDLKHFPELCDFCNK